MKLQPLDSRPADDARVIARYKGAPRGVVTITSPRAEDMPEGSLKDCLGFEVYRDGTLRTEPRFTVVSASAAYVGLPTQYKVQGAFVYALANEDKGAVYLSVADKSATTVQKVLKNERFSETASWTTLKSVTLGAGTKRADPVTFASLQDWVGICWFGQGYVWDQQPHASTTSYGSVSAVGGSQTLFPIERHHQRLYLGAQQSPFSADVTQLWRTDSGNASNFSTNEYDDPEDYGGSNINGLVSIGGWLYVFYSTYMYVMQGVKFNNRRYDKISHTVGSLFPDSFARRPDGAGFFFLSSPRNKVYFQPARGMPTEISTQIDRERYNYRSIHAAAADLLGDYYRMSPVPKSTIAPAMTSVTGPQQEGTWGWTYNWKMDAWTRSQVWKEYSASQDTLGDWYTSGRVNGYVQCAYDENFDRCWRFYNRDVANDKTVNQYLDSSLEPNARYLTPSERTDYFEFPFETLNHPQRGDVLDIWVLMDPMYPASLASGTSAYRLFVAKDYGSYASCAWNGRGVYQYQSGNAVEFTPGGVASASTITIATAQALFPLDGIWQRGTIDVDESWNSVSTRIEFRNDLAYGETGTAPNQGAIFREKILDLRKQPHSA